MTEPNFVTRYEELVKENESLKARLVAMDQQLETGDAPLRRINSTVGCKAFVEGVSLTGAELALMSQQQVINAYNLQAIKTLGQVLVYRAVQEGYVELAPRYSEGVVEAQMCLVKLK